MNTQTSYPNAVELKDGRIKLFTRVGAKKKVWQMRIYIKGMEDIQGEKVKYIHKSTGELDLDEAKRIAYDVYDDLRDKVRNKEPITDTRFITAYEQWWNERKKPNLLHKQATANAGKNAPKKSDRVEWYGKHFTRYWKQYFGDMKLSEITHSVSSEYWSWRISYWHNASEEEKRRYPNHATTPATKSLLMERSALRELFGYALEKKLINVVPNFYSKVLDEHKDTRRASFEREEYTKLDRYMRDKWVRGKGIGDKPETGKPNAGHIWQRQMVRRYIQWLIATGMRPGEPLAIQNKHIKLLNLDNGSTVLDIYLPHGKTGPRRVISQPSCVRYYEEIKKLTERTEADDYVFTNRKGAPSKGYGKTIKSLLIDLDMLEHPIEGGVRTAYSFRHYYAEERIRNAGANMSTITDLTANMGTGIDKIQKHYVRPIVRDAESLTSYKDR